MSIADNSHSNAHTHHKTYHPYQQPIHSLTIPETKLTPRETLSQWMSYVNEGNVEKLLGLYSPDAVLIPTFSNRILSKPEALREYFEKLATREELSIALHEKTLITQSIKDDMYSMSGIYCWRFAIDGELLNFEARFSYMLDLSLSSPILHHHSSQLPRML